MPGRPETIDTIPLETLAAYRDHGKPASRLSEDAVKATADHRMRLALCPSLVLTDERMAGANRIPVLILSDGTADQPTYRPHDSLKFAGHVMPAAHWTKLFGELKQEPKDREFIAQFLRSWPQGPQLSTPAGARALT